jgi:triphosphatase
VSKLCGLRACGEQQASGELPKMSGAMKKSAFPREVELKLRLPPDSRAILEASSLFASVPAKELHQVTTYFDTEDSALDRAGLTLRVRRIGATRIQTVKSRADGRGVATSRSEWEWRIGQDTPDISRLAKTPALTATSKTIKGKLKRLFVTDIHRTVRLLHLDDDTVVEAAIDKGNIKAGQAHESVSELELELKSGDVAPIYRLAAELQTLALLWISPESKAARGWHLLTGHMPEAQPARLPKLRRSVLAAPGFREIIAGTLGHLMTNIGPTLGGAAEGVHEMRIALRATRAALKLFEPHLAASTAARFDGQLQRFSRIFGTARDWDVFCVKTLPVAAAELATEQLRDLQAAAEVQRRIAHKAVVDIIRGHELTALVLGLACWVEAGAASPNLLGDDRMRKRLLTLAPALLNRVQLAAKRRARHVGRLSAEERHSLRKSLKKLCCDVESFSGMFRRDAVTTYHGRCEQALEILGCMNDAVVMRRLTRQLLPKSRSDLAISAATVVRWSKRRDRGARQRLKGALKALQAAPAFWN